MISMIMMLIGVLFIVFGIILTAVEIKGKMPGFYGVGQNAVRKNAIGIIAKRYSINFFRNGLDSIDSILTYGVFLVIELVVIGLYFLIRIKYDKDGNL